MPRKFVYKNHWLRLQMALGVLVGLAFPAIVRLFDPPGILAFVGYVLAFAGAAAALMGAREAIIIDRNKVIFRTLLRTKALPREEVHEFSLRSHSIYVTTLDGVWHKTMTFPSFSKMPASLCREMNEALRVVSAN